jgi:hypothetical protein
MSELDLTEWTQLKPNEDFMVWWNHAEAWRHTSGAIVARSDAGWHWRNDYLDNTYLISEWVRCKDLCDGMKRALGIKDLTLWDLVSQE